jgi:hypothetical protein
MTRAKPIALFENAAGVAAIASMLVAIPASRANAVQPSQEGCRAVSKIEYNAAKNENLLRQKFGTYVRTGRFWRHHYWYCR